MEGHIGLIHSHYGVKEGLALQKIGLQKSLCTLHTPLLVLLCELLGDPSCRLLDKAKILMQDPPDGGFRCLNLPADLLYGDCPSCSTKTFTALMRSNRPKSVDTVTRFKGCELSDRVSELTVSFSPTSSYHLENRSRHPSSRHGSTTAVQQHTFIHQTDAEACHRGHHPHWMCHWGKYLHPPRSPHAQ